MNGRVLTGLLVALVVLLVSGGVIAAVVFYFAQSGSTAASASAAGTTAAAPTATHSAPISAVVANPNSPPAPKPPIVHVSVNGASALSSQGAQSGTPSSSDDERSGTQQQTNAPANTAGSTASAQPGPPSTSAQNSTTAQKIVISQTSQQASNASQSQTELQAGDDYKILGILVGDTTDVSQQKQVYSADSTPGTSLVPQPSSWWNWAAQKYTDAKSVLWKTVAPLVNTFSSPVVSHLISYAGSTILIQIINTQATKQVAVQYLQTMVPGASTGMLMMGWSMLAGMLQQKLVAWSAPTRYSLPANTSNEAALNAAMQRAIAQQKAAQQPKSPPAAAQQQNQPAQTKPPAVQTRKLTADEMKRADAVMARLVANAGGPPPTLTAEEQELLVLAAFQASQCTSGECSGSVSMSGTPSGTK